MKSLHHLFFIVIVALASHNAHAASSNPPETPKEAVDAAKAANNKKRLGYRKRFEILGKRWNKKVEQESPQAVIEVNDCSSRTHPETKEIKMGSDSGELVYIPHKATVCSGDSVRWTNHHGLYDNIRFDEDAIPWGSIYEAVSFDTLLGERGDAFTITRLTIPGTYEYYSGPFRGAGMAGVIVVLSPETPKEAVDATKNVGYKKRVEILRKRGNKKIEQVSPQAVIDVNDASNDYCSSRTHPETKDIKMGSYSGELDSPLTATVCPGNNVRWTNHHGLYDNIRFTIPGIYEYYSEPYGVDGITGWVRLRINYASRLE